MKKFLLTGLLFCMAFYSLGVYADVKNQFHILPEVTNKTNIQKITKIVSNGKEYSGATEKIVGEEVDSDEVDSGSSVMERYQQIAGSDKYSLEEKMAAGVINWDSILEYLIYLIRFISQVGILIGAVMILYAGYCYAVAIFHNSGPSQGSSAIKNAIIGVVIITFSYAIMKILTSAFLGS